MRYNFLQETGISVNNVPAIYIFFDNKFYIHDIDSTEGNIEDPTTLLHLINKLMYPLLELKTEADVDAFLDLSQEPIETTNFFKNKQTNLNMYYTEKLLPTRALALIFSKDEYSEELKFIREAARNSARREALRFGIVSDPALVRIYKKKYGQHWFGDSVQLNGFIVKRFDGTIYSHNMLDVNNAINMQFFVNKKSVLPVQEAFTESHKVFDLIKQQIIVAIVDFKSNNKQIVQASKDLVENQLPIAAESLYRGFIVSWIDNTDTQMLRSIVDAPTTLPTILTFSEIDGEPIFCCFGKDMDGEGVRQWAQDVLLMQRNGQKLVGETRDAAIQQATINRDKS